LGTDNSGVLILNPATYALKICRHNEEDNTSVLSNAVSFIGGDRSKQVLVISNEASGFDIYTGGHNRFKVFQHQAKNNSSLINDIVQFIYEGHANNFYIGTTNGMIFFDPATGVFTPYQQIPSLNKWFAAGKMRPMPEESHHNYWFLKKWRSFIIQIQSSGGD
jgi:ligand-binding sensor domain-containing protein